MAHCWQHCYGEPGRRGYHNKEWADKMENIGLMPSSTGAPGGKKTGERMNDYPISEGCFIRECGRLVEDQSFDLPWVDRFAQASNNSGLSLLEDLGINGTAVIRLTTQLSELFDDEVFIGDQLPPKGKVKSRYTCPDCQVNVWGKPELRLRCEGCDTLFDESF